MYQILTENQNASPRALQMLTHCCSAAVYLVLLSAVDLHVLRLQSSLTTRAANDGGRSTTAYEGATFSSDDPDYKGQGGGLTH
jgi:hypothetical protein